MFNKLIVRQTQGLLVSSLILFFVTASAAPLNAQSQEAQSFYNEGLKYYSGEGQIKDEAKARALFEIASEKGHANASFLLAQMLIHGVGGVEDTNRGMAELIKAAKGNVQEAQFWVAGLYLEGAFPKNGSSQPLEAVYWLKKAAVQGHKDSQYTLGELYLGVFKKLNGQPVTDVPEDGVEAVKWFNLAAANDDAEACFRLFMIYTTGWGDIMPDRTEAAKWFVKAKGLGLDPTDRLRRLSK